MPLNSWWISHSHVFLLQPWKLCNILFNNPLPSQLKSSRPKTFHTFCTLNLAWVFKNYPSSLLLWIIFSSSPWNLLSSYVTNHDNFYVKFNILLICCNFQPASPLLLPASCLLHWHCFLWSTWSQSFFATSSRCKLLEICKTKVSFPIFHKLINFVKLILMLKYPPMWPYPFSWPLAK